MRYKDRTIVLAGEITDVMVADILKRMEELLCDDQNPPIHVLVNSAGGDLSSGMALFDCFRLTDTPVYTYALGTVYSAALWAYLGGDKRYSFPSSVFLLHPPRWGSEFESTPQIMRSVSDFASRHFEYSTDVLSKCLDISIDEVIEMASAETFFDASGAEAVGIVHEVLTSFPLWQLPEPVTGFIGTDNEDTDETD